MVPGWLAGKGSCRAGLLRAAYRRHAHRLAVLLQNLLHAVEIAGAGSQTDPNNHGAHQRSASARSQIRRYLGSARTATAQCVKWIGTQRRRCRAIESAQAVGASQMTEQRRQTEPAKADSTLALANSGITELTLAGRPLNWFAPAP